MNTYLQRLALSALKPSGNIFPILPSLMAPNEHRGGTDPLQPDSGASLVEVGVPPGRDGPVRPPVARAENPPAGPHPQGAQVSPVPEDPPATGPADESSRPSTFVSKPIGSPPQAPGPILSAPARSPDSPRGRPMPGDAEETDPARGLPKIQRADAPARQPSPSDRHIIPVVKGDVSAPRSTGGELIRPSVTVPRDLNPTAASAVPSGGKPPPRPNSAPSAPISPAAVNPPPPVELRPLVAEVHEDRGAIVPQSRVQDVPRPEVIIGRPEPVARPFVPRAPARTPDSAPAGLLPYITQPPAPLGAPKRPVSAGGPKRPGTTVGLPDAIQIHIGRIEVTAVQAAAPRPVAARARRSAPTLDEYLRRRDGRAS